jgi:hypothetical protein
MYCPLVSSTAQASGADAGSPKMLVDVQYPPPATLTNGLPAVRAGADADSSTMLSISQTFGTRHSPAFEPSLNPQAPLASCCASAMAVVHSVDARQPAVLSHTSPVSASLTVPSPLSTKRVAGQATPA